MKDSKEIRESIKVTVFFQPFVHTTGRLNLHANSTLSIMNDLFVMGAGLQASAASPTFLQLVKSQCHTMRFAAQRLA